MSKDAAQQARVLNVRLAVNLARHSVDGWTNAAIPGDFAAIENLLNISRETLLSRLQLPAELLPRLVRGDSASEQTG